MENFPIPPSETSKKPDLTGETNVAKKKKKKTTRVPKTLQPKVEKVTDGSAGKTKILEGIFEKKDDTKKDEQKSDKTVDILTDISEPVVAEKSEGLDSLEIIRSEDKEAAIELSELTDSILDETDKAPAVPPPFLVEFNPHTIGVIESTDKEGNELSISQVISIEHTAEPTETAQSMEQESFKVSPKVTKAERNDTVVIAGREQEHSNEVGDQESFVSTVAVKNQEQHPINDETISSDYGPELQAVRSSEVAEKPSSNSTETYSNQDLYNAKKRYLRKGVVSGALAGWWLGRRGKEEALQEVKRIEIANRQTERALAEARGMLQQKQDEMPTTRATDTKLERMSTDSLKHLTTARVYEQLQKYIPRVSKQEITPRSKEAPIYSAERMTSKPLRSQEVLPIKPEQDSELEKSINQPSVASEKRRVETSAWHRYEVDAETGKLAKNPELEYGKEFKHEQQQERLHRDVLAPAIAARHVGKAVVGQVTSASTGSKVSTSQNTTEPSLMNKKQSLDSPVQQVMQYTKRPLTWAIALIIVVLLFGAGILN